MQRCCGPGVPPHRTEVANAWMGIISGDERLSNPLQYNAMKNRQFAVILKRPFVEYAKRECFSAVVPARHLAVRLDVQTVAHHASTRGHRTHHVFLVSGSETVSEQRRVRFL